MTKPCLGDGALSPRLFHHISSAGVFHEGSMRNKWPQTVKRLWSKCLCFEFSYCCELALDLIDLLDLKLKQNLKLDYNLLSEEINESIIFYLFR